MLGGNWKMLASRQRDPSNPGSSGPAPSAASGDDEREARALDIKAFRWSGVFRQRSGSLSIGQQQTSLPASRAPNIRVLCRKAEAENLRTFEHWDLR